MNAQRIALMVGIVLMITVAVIGAWTFYDAWEAGKLPWQPEPTRVPVTPFANLPTLTGTPGS